MEWNGDLAKLDQKQLEKIRQFMECAIYRQKVAKRKDKRRKRGKS